MYVIKLDAIDSTNDYLRKLILEKKPTTPTVVMSQYQKKGKGQRGQVWTSQAGKNLMFSLYMPNFTLPTKEVFSINKIVSVCLLHWLSSFQIPNICVKWPNDILSGDSKLAGILIESTPVNCPFHHYWHRFECQSSWIPKPSECDFDAVVDRNKLWHQYFIVISDG